MNIIRSQIKNNIFQKITNVSDRQNSKSVHDRIIDNKFIKYNINILSLLGRVGAFWILSGLLRMKISTFKFLSYCLPCFYNNWFIDNINRILREKNVHVKYEGLF